MKSEFFTFSQDLESNLHDKPTRMIINDISEFFDRVQQKIYDTECLVMKKRKVREIQKHITGLTDKLGKRQANWRILLKICKRLYSLKEYHPEQFYYDYPVPVYVFNATKRRRKKQVAEIVKCLDSSAIDPDLKKIIIDLLKFQFEAFRVSPPSWTYLDYHSLLMNKIVPILKNNTAETLDWALARFLHRYNFNTRSINDYYIYKIDTCFNTNDPNDKISQKKWYHLLQNKPFKKIALDPDLKSLSYDLSYYLKIKLDGLEDKGASILSLYYPQYTCSTETRMLMEKLQVEVGYLVAPSCLKKHYHFLSENTRGIKGNKLTPKSYQNGYQKTHPNTYETVNKLLTEMLNINRDSMNHASKLLNRLPKKSK